MQRVDTPPTERHPSIDHRGPEPADRSPSAPGTLAGFEEEALPHLDAVYRFAYRLSGSESNAEDLVQETFLRAFRAWDSYERGTRCKSWLFTICRNAYLSARERDERRRELLTEAAEGGRESGQEPGAVRMGDPVQDPETSVFDSMIDDTVRDAIDRLPRTYRVAVLLSDVEDLSMDEAAAVLNIPVGTFKSRLHRGRRILRKELRDYAVMVGIVKE